jgi:predicted glycosyltransferase
MSRWRCLFWVQSLLGSGHLRRALLLADALARRNVAVTLVNGGLPGPWPAGEGVTLVQLLPIVAKDPHFQALIDASGAPVAEALRAERRQTLLDLLHRLRPHLVVTEMFPFGRRAFRGELLPLLAAGGTLPVPPLLVASVRDVLVSKPDPARYAWMAEVCREHYDKVLVHGDERLLPFALSFPLAGTLGNRIVHTGFVHPAEHEPPASVEEAPAVLISAGGGAVGEALLRAAIAARPLTSFAAASWLLVTGRNLAEPAFAALAGQVPAGCRLVRHRDDLPALMAGCAVSVSQAGYNTVVEGLMGRARMVLVPFAGGSEDEQERRAGRLAALGLAKMVRERELSAGDLAAAIDRIAAKPRPPASPWRFDGAARSAQIMVDLLEERFDAP